MAKRQKRASDLIPHTDAALHVLRERAFLLGKEELDSLEENSVAYIRFILGADEYYGLDYDHVHELLHHLNIAKVPCVPDFVAGVINWRGNLITVVNLNRFFHPQCLAKEGEFIMVVNVNELVLGIMIDQIKGNDSYQLDYLTKPLIANSVKPEYILGLDKSVTAIIDVEVLVTGINQEIKKGLHRI
ncbi:MAG: chemotaxis protein CheW [Legionella sp.]|uniref:chemotaxis protein CheW n=1 Tax=Legionella sp. TaxID=459 RepID=UPI0039E3F0A5